MRVLFKTPLTLNVNVIFCVSRNVIGKEMS